MPVADRLLRFPLRGAGAALSLTFAAARGSKRQISPPIAFTPARVAVPPCSRTASRRESSSPRGAASGSIRRSDAQQRGGGEARPAGRTGRARVPARRRDSLGGKPIRRPVERLLRLGERPGAAHQRRRVDPVRVAQLAPDPRAVEPLVRIARIGDRPRFRLRRRSRPVRCAASRAAAAAPAHWRRAPRQGRQRRRRD